MKKIKIGWGSPTNINWAVEIPEGYEIWTEQVCSHAFKSREYAPKLVETISEFEFEKRERKEAERVAASRAAKAKRKALEEKTLLCPCCGRETNMWEAEEYEGEYLCYTCLSGMYE
jgi:hypothetical protein